jgi:nicotinamidase-related amidase
MDEAKLEFLTTENSVLLLIDYQPTMFQGVESGDRTIIKNCAVGAARAASILHVPVVLTSISPRSNGDVIKEITSIFPRQEVYARKVPGFDALEDEKVAAVLKKTGRKKVVLSGLWTSICFAFTAIHAVREGLDVYGLIDASGDASPDAHRYGVERMIQVGVVPVTLLQVVSEWMHDWTNPKADTLVKEVYSRYDGMMGM